MSVDMIADEVNPVPIEMWNWGIQHRSGLLRQEDPELLRLKLLPSSLGTVSRQGVVFKNCYYAADDALKKTWIEKAVLKGKQISVAYDTRDMSCVYFKNNSGGFLKAQLTDKSRAYKGLSLREIQQIEFFKNDQKAGHKPIEASSNINTDQIIEDIIKESDSLFPDVSNQSKASRLANIAENKQAELRDIRKEENIHNQPELHIVGSEEGSTNKPEDEFQVPSRIAGLRNKKKGETKADE